MAPLLADGGITSLVKVVDGSGQSVATTPADFAWDAATRTLTWTAPAPLLAGQYEMQLSAIDIENADGIPTPGGTAGLPLGTPAFGAGQVVQANGADLAVNAYSVPEVADWNDDGKPDLIVGEQTAGGLGKVRVYLNTGTASSPVYGGSFYAQLAAGGDVSEPAFLSLGAFPRVADWNGDGKKDLLIGRADGQVDLYLNTNTDANPQFAAPTLLNAGTAGYKEDIFERARATLAVTDWNDDGKLDLVMGRKWDGGVRWYENDGTTTAPDLIGPIRVMDSSLILKVPGDESSVAVGDLNGDGRKDLLVGSANGHLYFYANHGTDADPMFDNYVVLPMSVSGNARPVIADVNGDGIPDLLVGAADGKVRLFLGQTLAAPTSTPATTTAAGYLFTYGFAVAPPVVAGTDSNDTITFAPTRTMRGWCRCSATYRSAQRRRTRWPRGRRRSPSILARAMTSWCWISRRGTSSRRPA